MLQLGEIKQNCQLHVLSAIFTILIGMQIEQNFKSQKIMNHRFLQCDKTVPENCYLHFLVDRTVLNDYVKNE